MLVWVPPDRIIFCKTLQETANDTYTRVLGNFITFIIHAGVSTSSSYNFLQYFLGNLCIWFLLVIGCLTDSYLVKIISPLWQECVHNLQTGLWISGAFMWWILVQKCGAMAGVLVLSWTQFQSRLNFWAAQSSTFHPKCSFFSSYNFTVICNKTKNIQRLWITLGINWYIWQGPVELSSPPFYLGWRHLQSSEPWKSWLVLNIIWLSSLILPSILQAMLHWLRREIAWNAYVLVYMRV